MPTRTRVIMVSILILFGGILFSYCTFCYPTDNAAQAPCLTTLTNSQAGTALQGGAEQDKSDQNKQTSSKSRSRYSGSI